MLWALVVLACACPAAGSSRWHELDALLARGVAEGVFPGAVGVVATQEAVLYESAVGGFTYGELPPRDPFVPRFTTDTGFDMASCSKVMATTTAAAVLYQRGLLSVTETVSTYLGAVFDANGKQNVRVVNLLTHDAGFPPDPKPGYWEASFGCPETVRHPEHPQLSWDCNAHIFASLLNQTLDRPPGVEYVYSDLSFIAMHYVIGSVLYRNPSVATAPLRSECASFDHSTDPGGVYLCRFEAFVRLLFSQLGMNSTGYLPSKWGAYPPTRNDTWYRHAVSQGTVDDENAFALGGVSGHAGVFSTAADIRRLLGAWLYGERPSLLNSSTVAFWTREYNHSVSCRALGWSTNDLSAPDGGWNGTCGRLSSRTFLHLGYTGTQICADPVNKVYTLLLSNRVYPTGANEKIIAFRQVWNDAIAAILGI